MQGAEAGSVSDSDLLNRQTAANGVGAEGSDVRGADSSEMDVQAQEMSPGTQGSSPSIGGVQGGDSGSPSELAEDGTTPVNGSNTRYQPVSATSGVNQPRLRDGLSAGQNLYGRPNPYYGIPSLFDMYLQASPHPATPERFGMRIFENGARDLQNVPMDLPAGPDYVVGPGDGLSIDMWGGVVRHFYRIVDREGRILLPEVGPMLVAGSSLGQLQQSVQDILRKQFRDVSADVSLSRLRTVRVYVVGDVVHPGAYDISSLSTPLNALFAAGGPTARGSLRVLKHYRGDQLIQQVDTYDLSLHGVEAMCSIWKMAIGSDPPHMGLEITVEGMVRRPAIYERKDEKSLGDVLTLAGGLLPTATLRHIEVQRVIEHEKQTMISLDVDGVKDSSDVAAKLDSFSSRTGTKSEFSPSRHSVKIRST